MKFYPKDISDDKCAFYRHYYFNNQNNLENLNIYNAYKYKFVEQKSFKYLDNREHIRMSKLKPRINTIQWFVEGYSSKSTF